MPRICQRAYALFVVVSLWSACRHRDIPGIAVDQTPAIEDKSEDKTKSDSPPVVTAKKEPVEAPKASTPVDVDLAYTIDAKAAATDCPVYQTTILGKNGFRLQLGEIGGSVAKGTFTPNNGISCIVKGEVTIPAGYLVDLDVASLSLLGDATLAEGDAVDYLVRTETINGLQYYYRYTKTVTGPKSGSFESTLEPSKVHEDIPCPSKPITAPFVIELRTLVRSSKDSTLLESEGYLNRAPDFVLKYRACKPV